MFLGISRHKTGWLRWAGYCREIAIGPGECSLVQLAEFCLLLCPEDPEGAAAEGCSGAAAMRSCLPALGSVASKVKVPALFAALADCRGLLKCQCNSVGAEEAVPFSLAAVSAIELAFGMN